MQHNKTDSLLQAAARNPASSQICDEHLSHGGGQSTIITAELVNNNVGVVDLVLGTPMGIPTESSLYPNMAAQLGDIATDAAFSPLVTDNYGVGAHFIEGINRRLVRNQMFIEGIEVVTPDNAQRQNPVRLIELPYNSEDGRTVRGAFKPVDTEYTGNNLLYNKGAVLGDFVGIAYQLNVGIQVDLNIKIGAVNAPSFVKCGY